jgi:DNA-binding NarL/FixJ family response regulator
MTTTKFLTVRQDQVARLVAVGHTNDEIAAELHIGPATVKRHVEDIRCALDARNRAHLVLRAIQVGLLDPFEVAA